MKKTVILIGAGTLQVPAIEIAREMNLFTIVTDYSPDAPGMRIADLPVVISTRDIEGTVRELKKIVGERRVDGVLTVGTDASMTVAAVANALRLPGIKFETAEAATNKLKMRRRFQEHGIPQPRFFEVWTLDDARRAARILGFPLVLKPSDNMGARGVIRVDRREDIAESFYFAKEHSPSGELIIEQYVPGDELSIDALIYEGEIFIAGVADRLIGWPGELRDNKLKNRINNPLRRLKPLDPEDILANPGKYPPFFVEMGHDMPSRLSYTRQRAAIEVMKKGIEALGINHGAAKGDIKVNRDGVFVGEIAARLSGGFMSAFTYPLHSGFSSIRAAIEIALGIRPDFPEKTGNRISLERAFITEPGREIVAIDGVVRARKVKNVEEVVVRFKPGDITPVPRSNMDKLGNVIVAAESRAAAEEAMKRAFSMIKVRTQTPPRTDTRGRRRTAIKRFQGACAVCRDCNGEKCAGWVPGVGGVGSGETFIRNVKSVREYRVNVNLIHSSRDPDSRFKFLGRTLSMPVMVAPMTGVETNMGGGMTEREFSNWILDGARRAGTIGFLGDGATPTKYITVCDVLKQHNGDGVAIFKPRVEDEKMVCRFREAERASALAVGIDIDAVAFITMALKNQAVGPRTMTAYRNLIKQTRLPFVMKGVMTARDARLALKSGANIIYVSNHGGRVLDSMPATIDVLPEIVRAIRPKKIPILVDGGIRTGTDVFKCLALGADAVLVGRPAMIAAAGGEAEGVRDCLLKIWDELRQTMILTGCGSLTDIKPSMVFRT